jgi:hypothetical protein
MTRRNLPAARDGSRQWRRIEQPRIADEDEKELIHDRQLAGEAPGSCPRVRTPPPMQQPSRAWARCPRENPSEMLKPCVVLTAPHRSGDWFARSRASSTSADTISMVEAEAHGEVIGPAARAGSAAPDLKNADRPMPAKSSKKKNSSKSRRTIEMEVEQSIKAGQHVTPTRRRICLKTDLSGSRG